MMNFCPTQLSHGRITVRNVPGGTGQFSGLPPLPLVVRKRFPSKGRGGRSGRLCQPRPLGLTETTRSVNTMGDR